MATLSGGRSGSRSVKSCTECKQVKLRCDSKIKFPAACTRCQNRNLQCRVDSSFRRTPARKRVEEMSRELETLRNSRPDNDGANSSGAATGDTSPPPPEAQWETSGPPTLDESGLDTIAFQLGSCELNSELVVDVFRIFTAFFYPHLPIIDRNICISQIFLSSPFLFWSVLAIVVSRDIKPLYGDIFSRLREPHQSLLQVSTFTIPLPLSSIQALAYLTAWPLPVNKQPQDPSWIYCGIITNAALYMGLNHPNPTPSLRSIGVLSGSVQQRRLAWLGCFSLSTVHGMFVGVSPMINTSLDLDLIERYARDPPVPREFSHQVMIQQIIAKYMNILLYSREMDVNHPLVFLVDSELDQLRSNRTTEWTPRVEFSLYVAKLHLYTMTVIRMQSDSTMRDVFLKLGFTAAIRIIYLANQGIAYTSEDDFQIPPGLVQRTIPKYLSKGHVLAAIFLLRYFALNSLATAEDQEVARNHVALTFTYMASLSTHPRDEYARVARLLGILSRQNPVNIEEHKLRIENRMGASLIFDAITTGVELRNEPAELTEDGLDDATKTQDAQAPDAAEEENDLELTGDPMEELSPLDFTLPDDIWGDALWGMFGIGGMDPSSHF